MPEQVNQNFLLSPWRNEEPWWTCNMIALLRTHITDCLPRYCYFTSQIHQILFSAILNVPSTYQPTVHLPQFPVAYCTNHLPWPSIQFFFNGLHFRLRGWWRHPHVSYPIIRLNPSKCLPLVRFKMDRSTSFCYNTQVCKTEITPC